MECARIKDLLSEYIDGALDAHTQALIDEHLLTCPNCKKEVVSLKALVKELGSLESVKAPDDFLEKLHERMKPRITLKKIMLVLFIPWRIKIPLEFASAMAMAVLIFSIFYNQPPTKIIHRLPEGESHIGITKQVATDMVRPSAKGNAFDPKPALKKAIPLRQAKK